MYFCTKKNYGFVQNDQNYSSYANDSIIMSV